MDGLKILNDFQQVLGYTNWIQPYFCIIRQCQNCVPFLSQPCFGVNPRGLMPNHIWQMDVTHVPSFGRLSFVHVSIDTCSGVLYASAHTGEKVQDVISHCLQAFAAWGVPQCYKTDNGPAYAAKAFDKFCSEFAIKHSTGIPYNPTGQAVVERAHATLKALLIKQKGGVGATLYPKSPKHQLALVTYIFNFLILDLDGHSAAERHTVGAGPCKDWVMWKDVLTKQWMGPHPVLRRTRGAVCVFPQDSDGPVWVPERLTRVIRKPEQDEPVDVVDADQPDVHSDTERRQPESPAKTAP